MGSRAGVAPAAEGIRRRRPDHLRERPPKSTYPACQAVKAAAEQRLDVAFGADLERARGRELPTFVPGDGGHEACGQVAPDVLAPGRERLVADVVARFGGFGELWTAA